MRKTALGLGPALVAIVIAAWEVVAVSRAGSDVPNAADWKRGAAYLRAQHEPGQLIVFAPRWLDPVGRMHLGDLIPVDMAARMDAARYGVLWEVSARGARAPEVAGLAPVSSEQFGELTIRRFERAPAEVVFDFGAAFAQAKVTGSAAGRPRVSLEEVGFAPHRCIRVEPRPGSSVRIDYPAVTLGTELVGYVGLADVFTRRDIREPGTLAVEINGREVAKVEAGVDSGWVRFSAVTEPSASAQVAFLASASARDRLICFAAEARK